MSELDRQTAALSVDGARKVYGDGTEALRGLWLRIPAGAFFGLLGPNGSGKSTLIGMVSGLVRAPAGRLFVFGHDAVADAQRTRLQLGVAPQDVHLDRFLSVREVLVYHGRYFGMGRWEAGRRADELLEVFDLAAKASSRPNRLSGGMRRRLLIARALVHRPRLVILDEPTAGVDLELRHELWSYLRRLHGEEAVTVLLTTHYLEQAQELCERVGFIRAGRLLAEHGGRADRALRRHRSRGRLHRGDALMAAAPDRAELRVLTGRATRALAGREMRRVLGLWTQTVLPPVIAGLIFLAIFGGALGGRLRGVSGVSYVRFIVPGLLVMTVAGQAFANNSTSLFQAKNEGYIEDVLTSPLRAWQLVLAYMSGGLLRGWLAALALALIAAPFAGAPSEPGLLLAALCLTGLVFAALGVITGTWADTFDQHAFIANLVISPLALLGGVFYAAQRLHQPWRTLTRADPLYYLVDATRQGWAGVHETSTLAALLVALTVAGGVFALAVALVSRGWRLKP